MHCNQCMRITDLGDGMHIADFRHGGAQMSSLLANFTRVLALANCIRGAPLGACLLRVTDTQMVSSSCNMTRSLVFRTFYRFWNFEDVLVTPCL
jgi:hypothetical protein